jgi:hypothetical protein
MRPSLGEASGSHELSVGPEGQINRPSSLCPNESVGLGSSADHRNGRKHGVESHPHRAARIRNVSHDLTVVRCPPYHASCFDAHAARD